MARLILRDAYVHEVAQQDRLAGPRSAARLLHTGPSRDDCLRRDAILVRARHPRRAQVTRTIVQRPKRRIPQPKSATRFSWARGLGLIAACTGKPRCRARAARLRPDRASRSAG